MGTDRPSDTILVKQAPCGKTSGGHLLFLLLKLNLKKGLTFGERTRAYEVWLQAKWLQGVEEKTKGVWEELPSEEPSWASTFRADPGTQGAATKGGSLQGIDTLNVEAYSNYHYPDLKLACTPLPRKPTCQCCGPYIIFH